MEYRRMGKTGLMVSELCLGAMTFGRESTEEVSVQMLNRFLEVGGNFIDTADVYSDGLSEEILGRWLKTTRRDQLVLATKVRFKTGEGVNDIGLSRKHILAGVENSLRRLGTDYIDLYQVHMWDPNTPVEETLHTLNGLVTSGKVRYIGASNFTGWQLQKAVDVAKSAGLEIFTCLQPLYNLLDRQIEWELIPVCTNEGIGVIPWSPLRGGWLSGKYQRGMTAPPANTRVEAASRMNWSESWDAYANERTWCIIDVLHELAEAMNRHPAQVALRWLLQKPAVTAPIIGVRSMQHLEINLGAAGWKLDDAAMQRLDEISEPDYPYPYGFLRPAKRT